MRWTNKAAAAHSPGRVHLIRKLFDLSNQQDVIRGATPYDKTTSGLLDQSIGLTCQ
jgi:hypothetical protein